MLLLVRLAALFVAGSISFVSASAAPADRNVAESRIAEEQAAQRSEFTDVEIIDGFIRTAFGSELQGGEAADRIRKFDEPVRVFLDNRARPDRRSIVSRIARDIDSKIAHLDLATTGRRDDANFHVMLVRTSDFAPTLRRYYGAAQAKRIERTLEPQCLAGVAKDASSRIVRAEVFLIVDIDDFDFRDCAYEEILQALGPVNDTDTVPWTMFNDDVSLGFFGIYDQLLLNLLYHPRIKAGMTSAEAQKILPEILPEVRAYVAGNNPPRR